GRGVRAERLAVGNNGGVGGRGESGRVGTGAATAVEGIADAARRSGSLRRRIIHGNNRTRLRGEQIGRYVRGNLRGADTGSRQRSLRAVGVPSNLRATGRIGRRNETRAGKGQSQ